MPASITGSFQGQCHLLCSLATWVVDGVNPQQVVGWRQTGRNDLLEGGGARRSMNSTRTNVKSCMWENNPMHQYGLADKEWESSFAENMFWWVTSWRGVCMPSQQRRLAACSVALQRAYLACQGNRDHIWSTRSSLGISRTRRTLTSLSKPSWDHQDDVYEETLRQLGLTLKKRREVEGLSRARPFSDVYGERMRGDGHKLQDGKFSWGKRRKFFTEWLDDGGRARRSCGISLLADIQACTRPWATRSNSKSSPEVTAI